MMHSLRAASETWIGRILSAVLMAFIVFSFAIFGIGDFFRGFGTSKLASVGSTEIPADSFRTAWAGQLQRLSARVKRNVTNEEARASGLDRQLLNQLVTEAVIDQQNHQMGLAISDEAVTALVTGDPTFKSASGAFDRARFLEVLRQNNLTERGFLEEQRKTSLRQEQVEAVTGAMNPPVALLEMLNKSRNERRSLDYFLLPTSAAGEIPAPSDEELAKYFAARAQGFRAPEYRKLTLLSLQPASLVKPDTISDAAALKRYEEGKLTRFTTPEKRDVQQMAFPTEAEAKDGLAKIRSGIGFEALAKERNLDEKDIELGLVEKKALLGDLGETAFALAEGAVSEPLKNVFGYSLLRAVKVIPATTKPFSELSNDLKREVASVNALKDVQTIHDKIEDLRTSGKPLAEAAVGVGLVAQQIEAVDASGRDKTGAPVMSGLADPGAVLKAAFASGVGFDNDTINTKERGYIWFEVQAVEAARANTLEEVRDRVLQAWREEETAKRLSTKAAELVKQLNGGADFAQVADQAGKLAVQHVGDAQRKGNINLPPTVSVQAFNVGVGGAGSALAPGGRIVFKVLDKVVQPLDATSTEAKTLETELRAALAEEISTQYVAQLQSQTKVTINEPLLRQLTGSEAN